MVDEILVSEIVASLVRRGFTSGDVSGVEDLVTQVLAVDEELGEVARMARRIRQGVDPIDNEKIADECVDVLIAATCLASKACGSALARIIKAKLARDEQRGFLHRGGPLNPLPASLMPAALYSPLNGGYVQAGQQRLSELAADARRVDVGAHLWLALRMPEGYTGGLEIQGLFHSRVDAAAACQGPRDVIGPVPVGVSLTEVDKDWRAEYPKLAP